MAAVRENLFKNLKKVDRNTITFTLSPTRVSYANTLRRAVQTEVDVLGFSSDITENGSTSDVKILKNSTPMSNEMLADRIGLIPLALPKKQVSGWKKQSVLFKLHVKNESTDEMRYVTASDFECLMEKEGVEERERIPNTNFFYPDRLTGETCLIAVLKPMVLGQKPEEIEIEAYASLGKGKEHARFNPTCQCSYGYTRDESPAKVMALWQDWLITQKKIDPKELEKTPEKKVLLEREFRSLSIFRCYLEDKEGEPYSYDFTIETLGYMGINKIVYSALLSIASLAKKYASMDRGDLPENIEIRPADAALKGFDLVFRGEDHTFGNMIQTWLDDNKVGQGVVTYAGYKIPHPLRKELVLRIGVEEEKESVVRRVLAEAAKGCSDMFLSWANMWMKAMETAGEMDEDFITPVQLEEGEAEVAPEFYETTTWKQHEKARLKKLEEGIELNKKKAALKTEKK